MPIFGSLAVIRFTFYLLRRVFARDGRAISTTMMAFEKIFQLLVWLAFVLYITGLWVDVFAFMDDTVLPIGKYKVSIADILQATAVGDCAADAGACGPAPRWKSMADERCTACTPTCGWWCHARRARC